MREELYKAHDIIIENQRNADNKAYIFIVMISAFLALMDKVPINFGDENQQKTLYILIVIFAIPLFLFILSLIPIYKNNFKVSQKKFSNLELNIFYWKSIIQEKDEAALISKFTEKYISKTISEFEKDLLRQIYANANILENKKRLHSIAFQFIIQFIILISCSLLHYMVFMERFTISLIILIIVELVYIIKLKRVIPVFEFKKGTKKNEKN